MELSDDKLILSTFVFAQSGPVRKLGQFSNRSAIFQAKALQNCELLMFVFGKLMFPNTSSLHRRSSGCFRPARRFCVSSSIYKIHRQSGAVRVFRRQKSDYG